MEIAGNEKCITLQGMENSRNHLHTCRGLKIQVMENERKEKTGKCKEWKTQEMKNAKNGEY